jgi:hypothetical protein
MVENNGITTGQERFHDRIIRNNIGLEYARAYIFNNPKKWDDDELNICIKKSTIFAHPN